MIGLNREETKGAEGAKRHIGAPVRWVHFEIVAGATQHRAACCVSNVAGRSHTAPFGMLCGTPTAAATVLRYTPAAPLRALCLLRPFAVKGSACVDG